MIEVLVKVEVPETIRVVTPRLVEVALVKIALLANKLVEVTAVPLAVVKVKPPVKVPPASGR